MKLQIKPNKKQEIAWKLLLDSTTKYILFGGAAGPGKSWQGCEWEFYMSMVYPGTRWFIARDELKKIRETTLQTLFKVFSHHKIDPSYYNYNAQDHYIQFVNGSRIDLIDLKFVPRDPLYERLGSYEFTGGFIEEAGEVHKAAFDMLKTRVGRWKNKEYGLLQKIFCTANPKRNWIYHLFYKPYKLRQLPSEYACVFGLAKDNPHNTKEYLKSLHDIDDNVMRERLLKGNWEYSTEEDRLFELDALDDMFTNKFILPGPDKYMTCDVARLGSDLSVFGNWAAFVLEHIHTIDKMKIPPQVQMGQHLAQKYAVSSSFIVADEDGIGGGFVDSMECKGFINNSKPIKEKGKFLNYANLKSQCAYKFAKRVNERGVRISDRTHEERIKEDLDVFRRKEVDAEGKLALISKEDMKEKLRRSPDFGDMLIMREYFEIMSGKLLV